VYLALDPFTNREVAVKVVNASALGDKETGKRYRKLFLTEASLVGKLAHPHIATIFDAAEEDEASYIVMEYVAGETLQKYCQLDNLLPVNKTIEIIFKCCRALVHAQQQGIIHRDIKPANILLTPDGDIKITDFGAALAVASDTTPQPTRARVRVRSGPQRAAMPPADAAARPPPPAATDSSNPRPPWERIRWRSMSAAATAQVPQNAPNTAKTAATGRRRGDTPAASRAVGAASAVSGLWPGTRYGRRRRG